LVLEQLLTYHENHNFNFIRIENSVHKKSQLKNIQFSYVSNPHAKSPKLTEIAHACHIYFQRNGMNFELTLAPTRPTIGSKHVPECNKLKEKHEMIAILKTKDNSNISSMSTTTYFPDSRKTQNPGQAHSAKTKTK